MIDFRYHIVSLIAVFLALGVGIIVGTTVLDAATVNTLEGQLGRLRSSLAQARGDIQKLKQSESLVGQLAPWVVDGQLAGRQFVTVNDGQSGRWRDQVRDALGAAGAIPIGSLTLTDQWKLDVPGAADELQSLVVSTIGGADPAKLAASTLQSLGREMFDASGHALLRGLVESRYVTVADAELRQDWPPDGALVVAFAGGYPKGAPQPSWLADLARGASEVTGTLVVSAGPDEIGAVRALREAGVASPRLATFDSGGTAFNRELVRIGAVLAMEAAAAGRGGNFGTSQQRIVPQRA